MAVESERPLRADAERNRCRLLEAAREVFATRGLEVSMDDIARAAGVGVGTAYRRFRSREEIVAALFDERISQMEELAARAAQDPDAWRGMTSFFESSLQMQVEDRGFKELLFSSVDGRERITRMRARIITVIEALVQRARDSGDLRSDVDVSDLTVLSFMVGAVVDFTSEVDPGLWRRYLALLLDGLRAGSASPLPGAGLEPAQLERAMECWHPRHH